MTGTKEPVLKYDNNSVNTNIMRLSVFVGLLPFFENQALWEQIFNPLRERSDGALTGQGYSPRWNAMGPTPEQAQYPPWITELPALRCPSDPGVGLPALGRTNYAVCMGDAYSTNDIWGPFAQTNYLRVDSTQSQYTRSQCRGTFVPATKMAFRDVLNGLANTIMMGEIATDLGDADIRTEPHSSGAGDTGTFINTAPALACSTQINAARPQFWGSGTATGTTQRRGYMWASAVTTQTMMNTIFPPNKQVRVRTSAYWHVGPLPSSSRHQGGCHVLMGDGAVKFITDSIEAGNQNQPVVKHGGAGASAPGSESSYGLWGSLGTRASKEVLPDSI